MKEENKIKSTVNDLDKNGETLLISIFSTDEFTNINISNMSTSLLRITNYIQKRDIKGKLDSNLPMLAKFGQAA